MYLIIGASGFIGRHLYDYCIKNGKSVLGTYCMHSDNPKWVHFDICRDSLREILTKYADGEIPEAIIVCSANGSIDGCKRNENISYQLNVAGMQRVIGEVGELGVKCVFLSSEAVFDGKKGMYEEKDITNPVTLYGQQKVQIEQYISRNLKKYLIFRISRAVGSQFEEKDIFSEFYNKIVHEEEIVCLKDQSFCLTEVGDIAQGIVKALELGLNGLFHLSSANYISRYELAQLYAKKIFGKYDKIIEKDILDMNFLDNRHIFGGLNGKKLADILEINYLEVDDILNKYMKTLDKKRFVDFVQK